MNPLALPPALSPDTLSLLRYSLTAILLVYLPFLGTVIAGSSASLVLNFLGREHRDSRSLRLSGGWIEVAAVNRKVLFLLGLLPYPAVACLYRRILGGADPLPGIAWLVPFAVFLAGFVLLSVYRSVSPRTTSPPPASVRAGTAGLLAVIAASFLLFLLLGTLVDPAKLPLIRSNLVFILSWNSLVAFLLFLALSFGLSGGIGLLCLVRPKGGKGDPDPEYEANARTVGTSLALAGALALPALIVLYLITLPATGLSTEVFALALTVPILALVVCVLLYLLPGREGSRPGVRESGLFLLMFLAVLLCNQAAVGNASQGLSAPPPGPFAAEKASREGMGGAKPAADAAALEKGKKVFDTVCSVCHRFDAKLIGPAYNDVLPKYKGDVEKLKKFIRNPVKVNPALPAMPKPAIKEDEIDAVARYLLTKIKGSK